MSRQLVVVAAAVVAAAVGVVLEIHLRRKDVDRRVTVDASLYLIDNEFCKEKIEKEFILFIFDFYQMNRFTC
jgi:hypothetical protein